MAHVLARERTFLARRVLILLQSVSAASPSAAAAVVRRYYFADAARPLTNAKSPCRTNFVGLLTTLVTHVDSDSL